MTNGKDHPNIRVDPFAPNDVMFSQENFLTRTHSAYRGEPEPGLRAHRVILTNLLSESLFY
jgi:hypothetical protein